jgi:hypothetical protein
VENGDYASSVRSIILFSSLSLSDSEEDISIIGIAATTPVRVLFLERRWMMPSEPESESDIARERFDVAGSAGVSLGAYAAISTGLGTCTSTDFDILADLLSECWTMRLCASGGETCLTKSAMVM